MTVFKAARWYRFDRYEVSDRRIHPAEGAHFEWYSPWADYNANPSAAPYLSLFDLLQSVGLAERDLDKWTRDDVELGRNEQRLIREWCEGHGPLGLGVGDLGLLEIELRRPPELPESVEGFLFEAALLRGAVEGVRLSRGSPLDQLLYLSDLLRLAGDALQQQIAGPENSLRLTPSLIQSYAAMALVDLIEQRDLVACQVCGRLFGTRGRDTRYCSDRCKNTAQRRAYRRRKREGSL